MRIQLGGSVVRDIASAIRPDPWVQPGAGDRPPTLGKFTDLPRRGWGLANILYFGPDGPGDEPNWVTCQWCGNEEVL